MIDCVPIKGTETWRQHLMECLIPHWWKTGDVCESDCREVSGAMMSLSMVWVGHEKCADVIQSCKVEFYERVKKNYPDFWQQEFR